MSEYITSGGYQFYWPKPHLLLPVIYPRYAEDQAVADAMNELISYCANALLERQHVLRFRLAVVILFGLLALLHWGLR